jgi:hypothetical protein
MKMQYGHPMGIGMVKDDALIRAEYGSPQFNQQGHR